MHNFLGFAYRSDTDAEPWKARDYVVKGYAHYHASLTLNPENCGAPRSRQRLGSSLQVLSRAGCRKATEWV